MHFLSAFFLAYPSALDHYSAHIACQHPTCCDAGARSALSPAAVHMLTCYLAARRHDGVADAAVAADFVCTCTTLNCATAKHAECIVKLSHSCTQCHSLLVRIRSSAELTCHQNILVGSRPRLPCVEQRDGFSIKGKIMFEWQAW